MELHRDGTVTVEESGEGVREINYIIGANPGVRTDKSSWPNEQTPPEWRQPGRGVWQFRKAAAVPTKPEEQPEEKPVEPAIASDDPEPPKLSLPKEKSLMPEPASRAVRSEGSSGEREIDRLPPSFRRRFAALSAERKSLVTKYYQAYDLGLSRSAKLLEWLSDDKLPLKEVEIRACLLLVTDQRYRQCYSTIVSNAVDNYVDGRLWEQAAKVTPIAGHISRIKDLATMPYDIATVAYEYQDAADAEAVPEKFVQTWGKNEEEAVARLFATKNAIQFWNRSYAQAEKKFREAQTLAPPATANRPPATPEEQRAVQAMEEAYQTMTSATKELKKLNLEAKAWNLRIKAIRGDWKQWMVRWEK